MIRFAAVLAASLVACSSSSTPPSTSTADTGTPTDVDAALDAPSDVPEPLTYPPSPYGINEGDTFPDVTWDGFRSGTTAAVKISSVDYYDPKGDRGIRAALIVINGVPKVKGGASCGSPCDGAFAAVSTNMTGGGFDWQKRGIRSLEVGFIYPDKQVTLATLTSVRAPSALDEAVLLLDTSNPSAPSMAAPFDKVPGVSFFFIVDPRTMKIAMASAGVADMGDLIIKYESAVEKLAIANGAPPKP